jgi:hypothetical protein
MVVIYRQDFNALASSLTGTWIGGTGPGAGTFTNPALAGVHVVEGGANANSSYTAGTGSSNTGDTYSFGAAGSDDRALGGLQSNALVPNFGISFVNTTGSTLTSFTVTYTGEQWRLGAVGRVDRLDFQYSTNATSFTSTSATWTNFDALDFTAPVTSGSTGALDGNAAANRTLISAEITGVSIAPGQTVFLRFSDFNAAGSDDGLAIDDLSISVADGPVDDTPVITVSATDASGSEAGADTTIGFTFTRQGDVSQALTVSYTVGGSATAGSDYTGAATGTVTFAAGQSTAGLAFRVLDDTLPETDETVQINLTAGTGYRLGEEKSAAATIVSDDIVVTRIHEIQGSGATSGMVGRTVTVEAVVVGDFQNGDADGARNLGGFFIQEENADHDGNAATPKASSCFRAPALPRWMWPKACACA